MSIPTHFDRHDIAGPGRLDPETLEVAPGRIREGVEGWVPELANETELGEAFSVLSNAAAAMNPKLVSEEYHELFIGLTRGQLLPYGSYYLTGFLHEKPLAALRTDLVGLGVARAVDVSEPEDHAAALCEVMAGLIDGAYGLPQPVAVQRRFFDAHMAPWLGRLFADLAGAEAAGFYVAVGQLGRRFMEIERAAFAMDA